MARLYEYQGKELLRAAGLTKAYLGDAGESCEPEAPQTT